MKLDSMPEVQRTPHQPFPIAAYTEGMSLAKQPWLSPVNAFRVMTNARIFRGQLLKRGGTSRFAEVGVVAAQVGTDYNDAFTAPYLAYYTGNPDSRKIVPESCLFTAPNGGAPITARILQQTPVWTSTDDYLENPIPNPPEASFGYVTYYSWIITAVDSANTPIGKLLWADENSAYKCLVSIDWFLHLDNTIGAPTAGVSTTMDYSYNEENEIVGMTRYQNQVGNHAVAIDENNLYAYDPTMDFYAAQGKASAYDYFTGDDEDYFWTWPVDDYLVVTNNKDPVHKWTPGGVVATSIEEMPTDWTGGANLLTRCLLAIRFKGRMIYFNTVESGGAITDFPTRARFTAPGSNETWYSPLDFTDAPLDQGAIVTGQFIGKRLFIGFEQGWMEFVSTGDAIQPFRWEPFISRFGAVSKLSTIQDNEKLLSRSKTSMQALDPNGQYYYDKAIPDVPLAFDPDNAYLCAAARNEAQRAFWWTYVRASQTRPNNILCATYDEEGNVAWSEYSMRFNVFSDFDSDQNPSWDSLGPDTWNEYPATTWNDASVGAVGFTQTLGGSDQGIIHKFDQSVTDWKVAGPRTITFSIETEALAPFPGQVAHMGWIDFFMNANAGSFLRILLYADKAASPYMTYLVDMTGESTGQKIYRRIPVDRTASFHSFQILSADSGPFEIDAIVPWFRPAGRIRGFN
jgi:hypothetical protein